MTITYAENIVGLYALASDEQREAGMSWYQIARDLAWEISPDDVRLGAGIIAVYSIQRAWNNNVTAARQTMATGIPYPGLSMVVGKAQAMLDGDEPFSLLGTKTFAFASNIVGEDSVVTVDRHARDIAFGAVQSKNPAINKTLYAEIADAYILAASAFNISPADMQAVTWVVWRDRKGLAWAN